MKIISMKQLRQKFGPIRKGLSRGEAFLLMYRSKPLAVVRPYSPDIDAKHLTDEEQEQPTISEARLNKLPDPKTVSFGSELASQNKPPLQDSPRPSIQPAQKALDKLGMKKAFL